MRTPLTWILFGYRRPIARSNGIGWLLAGGLGPFGTRSQLVQGVRYRTSESKAGLQIVRNTRIISTLKQEDLRARDFVDFLEIRTPAVGVRLPGDRKGQFRFVSCGLVFPATPSVKESKGFLYYHIPHGKPPISGELRFRVTPTRDPDSFDDGYDMRRPNGFYWRLQLPSMPVPMRERALHDGLITNTIAAECAKLDIKMSSTNLIFYLEQPFSLDFTSNTINFSSIKDGIVRKVSFPNPLRDRRGLSRHSRSKEVYQGSAVARLELSTLPEHVNTNMVVIRILKIIQPVERILPDYDGYIEPPSEGALIARRSPSGAQEVFVLDINGDDAKSVALQVLLQQPTSAQLGSMTHSSKSFDTALSTLDPGRISTKDALALVGTQPRLSVTFKNENGVTLHLPIPLNCTSREGYVVPGFLYYYKPPNLPELAGEIRYRVTSASDPSTFKQGTDLMTPDGDVWSIPLLKVVLLYEPLCQMLVRDQLVTPSLLLHCRTLLDNSVSEFRRDSSSVIHALEQPFQLDFSKSCPKILSAGPKKLISLTIPNPYHVDESGQRLTGRAWVKFEKSPCVEDAGKNITVLRLLEPTDISKTSLSSCFNNAQRFTSGPLVSQTTRGGVHVYKVGPRSPFARLLWSNTP